MNDICRKIVDTIGPTAALEQLAEECTELAHAALKLARINRGGNPTPMDFEDAYKYLIEELADVRACVNVLDECYPLRNTRLIEERKMQRWKHRMDTDPPENDKSVLLYTNDKKITP